MKIEENVGKKQTTYYVRMTVNGKRKKINLGHNYAEALQKVRELEANPHPNNIVTLTDLWEKYKNVKLPQLAASTQYHYIQYWDTQIGPMFGHFKLDELYPSHIREYLNKRTAKVNANREKSVISLLYTYAINELELKGISNPCFRVRSNPENGRGKYVEKWEYEKIYHHADQLTRDFMDLLLYTGQRPGDVIDMRVSDIIKDVDLTATLLHDGSLLAELVNKRFGDFLKVKPNKTSRKTGAKVRIFIEGPLEDTIQRIMNRRRFSKIESVYLLHYENGGRLDYRSMHSRFVTALKKAGLKIGDVQMRDLRAKNASDDTLENANRRLAHSHTDMTDRYRNKARGVLVRPLLKLL